MKVNKVVRKLFLFLKNFSCPPHFQRFIQPCLLISILLNSPALLGQAQGGGGIAPNRGSAEGGGEVETQNQQAQEGGGFKATNNNQGAEVGGGFNPQAGMNNAEAGGGFNPSGNSNPEDTNAVPTGGLNIGKKTATGTGGLNLSLSESATQKSLPWGLIIGAALLIIIGLTTFKLNRKKNSR